MMESKRYNVLIICTSNKDRSPALSEYFKSTHPIHEYRSAGINKYFCGKKGTHYLTDEDVEWAHIILFAEDVHKDVFDRDFYDFITDDSPNNYEPEGGYVKWNKHNCHDSGWDILNCGEYKKGGVGEDYLTQAELVFDSMLNREIKEICRPQVK